MPGLGVEMDVPFAVWAENKQCKNGEAATCSKAVTVQRGSGKDAVVIR